jgi:uncharacterized membrane protein YdbT with pleckstrin-like domain
VKVRLFRRLALRRVLVILSIVAVIALIAGLLMFGSGNMGN